MIRYDGSRQLTDEEIRCKRSNNKSPLANGVDSPPTTNGVRKRSLACGS